jgi:hypothetical protein
MKPVTESEAFAILPRDAKWSSTFGNPGESNYSEFYRTLDGRRWEISRKDECDYYGWECKPVMERSI